MRRPLGALTVLNLDLSQVPGWREIRALRARLRTGRARVIIAIVALIAAALVPVVFPPVGLSEPGRYALSLFGIAAVLWMTELVPLFVTSLIILAFEMILLVPVLVDNGVPVGEGAFMSPFFSNVTLLFLGGLLLAQAATRHRLDLWFAARLLRLSGGRPDRVLLALMVASAFLSMWMSNTATTAMMLILVVALVRQLPPDSGTFRKALFLGVPFACNLGGLGTPIGTPPNAIAVSLLDARGEGIGFLTWIGSSMPVLIVLLFILWRLLLRMYPPPETMSFVVPGRPGEEGTGASESQFSTVFPAGWKPRATMTVFLVSIALWLTGGLTGLSSGAVALLAAIALLATKLLDARDFRGLNWDVLFLVGGGLALGLGVQITGLADWVGAQLNLASLSIGVAVALFVVLAATLTTFMSNTATANMLMPLALSIPPESLGSATPLVVAVAMATSTSMLLPVSTPPNAIAYYSGEVEIRDMLRSGFVISIIAAILTWVSAMTIWSL